MEVGLGPGNFVLDGDSVPRPQKGQSPLIFGACLLWPNGWMDQDATWYGGRPSPGDFVLDRDLAPPENRAQPHPIFGSCLLCPNGWMDEDATWYGSRPWPRPFCVRWGPSSPPLSKGHSSLLFSAHVYCGHNRRFCSCKIPEPSRWFHYLAAMEPSIADLLRARCTCLTKWLTALSTVAARCRCC